MTEIFKPIEDYEGYSVSNTGKVLNNETGKFLKGSADTKGHLQVKLYKDKKGLLMYKHRLVAIAFIPNPENKPCVDHRNNDKLNNSLENLRWATVQENSRNIAVSSANECRVKGVRWYKSTSKWCARIMVDGVAEHLGYFDSKEDAILARQSRSNEAFGEFVNDCEVPK